MFFFFLWQSMPGGSRPCRRWGSPRVSECFLQVLDQPAVALVRARIRAQERATGKAAILTPALALGHAFFRFAVELLRFRCRPALLGQRGHHASDAFLATGDPERVAHMDSLRGFAR